MPSQYRVLKYGDVIKGEYLNFGVFAFDADPSVDKIYVKFVTSLNRLFQAFSNDPILESLWKTWSRKEWTRQDLDQLIYSVSSPWSSLQITEPRASLSSPEDLLVDIAKDLL